MGKCDFSWPRPFTHNVLSVCARFQSHNRYFHLSLVLTWNSEYQPGPLLIQFLQQPCQLACQKITFSNARMPWHKNGVDVCQTWLLRRLQILSFSKNPFYFHEHVHWVAEEETWGKVSDSNQATVFVTVTISIVRLDFDVNIRNQNLDPPSKTITAPCPSVNIARWRCKLFQ